MLTYKLSTTKESKIRGLYFVMDCNLNLQYLYLFPDQTHLAREKAKADAYFYKVQRDAESNKVS